MTTSLNCDHAYVEKKIQRYTTTMFGLSLTLCDTATSLVCSHCGHEKTGDVSIPFPKRLMSAAALYRCTLPQRLNGTEMKFVRKAMNISSKDWAARVSTDPSTLSRWESDAQAMSAAAEKLLRLTAIINLVSEAPAIDVDKRSISDLKLDGFAQPDVYVDMQFVLSKYRKEELYSDLEEKAA